MNTFMQMHGYVKAVRDLDYASLLKSQNFELDGIEWKNGVAYWIFSDSNNQADEIINRFANGKIIGNLKDFSDAKRTLRQMLFNKGN